MKCERIETRVTEEFKTILKEAAKKEKLSITEFINLCITEHIEKEQ